MLQVDNVDLPSSHVDCQKESPMPVITDLLDVAVREVATNVQVDKTTPEEIKVDALEPVFRTEFTSVRLDGVTERRSLHQRAQRGHLKERAAQSNIVEKPGEMSIAISKDTVEMDNFDLNSVDNHSRDHEESLLDKILTTKVVKNVDTLDDKTRVEENLLDGVFKTAFRNEYTRACLDNAHSDTSVQTKTLPLHTCVPDNKATSNNPPKEITMSAKKTPTDIGHQAKINQSTASKDDPDELILSPAWRKTCGNSITSLSRFSSCTGSTVGNKGMKRKTC